MPRIIDNILIVTPPEYTHSQCFYDIAMSFRQALKEATGVEPLVTIDSNDCQDGTTLVFGSHLIAAFNGTIEGDDYILFQTEQLTDNSPWTESGTYFNLLQTHEVWDYSKNNIATLNSRGIDAIHVPIGYSRCLSNIRTGRSVNIAGPMGQQRIDFCQWSGIYPKVDHNGRFEQDIDICFFGSVNDRRAKIANRLLSLTETVGRPVTSAFFTGYGAYRDKMIARSKIVLNLHYYDSAIFEIFRCAHLFANRKCVVSETGNDQQLEVPYANTGMLTPYDSIVEKCAYLLQNDSARDDMAAKCNEIFKAKSQAEILKEVL